MREPKNQMLGTMEPPLMQLSVKQANFDKLIQLVMMIKKEYKSENFNLQCMLLASYPVPV